MARQWGDTDERPDPQWYEQIRRECREWREQPAREWREWSEQLAREAQQMREQCERDRQPIREKIQQNRKEQAEQYLEERVADLLGQAHTRAQYEVCQACMFPLPSARPARQSGSSRPRAPSPPPIDHETLQWEDSVNMNGHNDKFRTVIRRVLRNGIGLSQERAQVWAQKTDYFVDWVVIKGTFKAIESRNGVAVGVAAMAAAVDARGVYRYVRHDPSVITDELKGKAIRFIFNKLKSALKLEKKFPNQEWF